LEIFQSTAAALYVPTLYSMRRRAITVPKKLNTRSDCNMLLIAMLPVAIREKHQRPKAVSDCDWREDFVLGVLAAARCTGLFLGSCADFSRRQSVLHFKIDRDEVDRSGRDWPTTDRDPATITT
jgi:hypothetical protein